LGAHSMLVATVSHFQELEADLEVHGSGCSAGLTENEADALWSGVRMASDSLVAHVPSSMPITLLIAWQSSGGSLCR
jgi:hypothetical protein